MDIVWFKISDLRVRDHEPLYLANQTNKNLIHIFIWDCRWDDKTSNDIQNMGKLKKKFLKESLFSLNKNLKDLGIDLNIFFGKSEKILSDLISKYNVSSIYTYQNIDKRNMKIDSVIMKNNDINLAYSWGNTLNHICDLPFTISELPNSFNDFKNKIGRSIRKEFFTKGNGKSIKLENSIELNDIDIPEVETINIGGEDEIWEKINNDFYKNKVILNYQDNNFLDNICYYNPWLTFGCISYKSLFFQLKIFEKRISKNKNTYFYFKNFLLNDYIKFSHLKNNINIQDTDIKSSKNKMSFKKWIDGNTGIPIIDAIMNEIKMTGKTHNRCKLITASFLINDLNLDWILGFEYFNKVLIDISAIENLNIWNYIHNNKIYYNPIKQIQKYDKECSFVKKWIPDLDSISINKLYDPQDGIKDYYQPLVKINFLNSNNP
jgi:deoxyribodipyrimidine photo-lyase